MARRNGNIAVEGGGEEQLATEISQDEIMIDSAPVEAEEPKSKVGDKPPAPTTTVVDGANGEKRPRLSMPRGNQVFRIKPGVDANKYAGQRGHVIRALQKLAADGNEEKYFTIDEIFAKVEGLVTRVDPKASVTWHLKGLVASQQADVSLQEVAAPPAAEVPAATAVA